MAKRDRYPSASEITHRLKTYGNGKMADGLKRLERESTRSGYDQGVRDTLGMSVIELMTRKIKGR